MSDTLDDTERDGTNTASPSINNHPLMRLMANAIFLLSASELEKIERLIRSKTNFVIGAWEETAHRLEQQTKD